MQTQVHVMVFHLNLYLRIEADKMCMHELTNDRKQSTWHRQKSTKCCVQTSYMGRTGFNTWLVNPCHAVSVMHLSLVKICLVSHVTQNKK